LRGQVRRALRPYQRQERLQASAKYFQESWRRRSAWRFAPEQKMTLPQKGLTIALVGVDGAGKSTLCAGLSNWLGWKLESPLYYLGSKQPSRRSQWLYTFFRMARRSQREMSTRFGENGPVVRLLANIRQTLLYSHQLSIGYDRYRRYQFAQKKAEGGAVVIFDRYPFEAPLDGPEIHIMSRGQAGLLSVYFSRLEQELYRRFGFPDFLVLLRVSPQLSMQRKPDHLPETIAAKHRALDALQDTLMNHPRKNWALVDANAAYEDVLLQVKQQIWAIL
jgi:thymidylate kinase